jgi:hypothetical protein
MAQPYITAGILPRVAGLEDLTLESREPLTPAGMRAPALILRADSVLKTLDTEERDRLAAGRGETKVRPIPGTHALSC